ncbi:MAG TPA: cellulase family glycosylhydrolase [Steroidobacteraceae bacterium]|nr:cellulase family glycosylhydrolase [Steroidobacteraceae bacterium]
MIRIGPTRGKIGTKGVLALMTACMTVLLLGLPQRARAALPLLLGVNVSFSDGTRAIEAAHALGATAVRMDTGWARIERAKGQYQIPGWLDQWVNSALASHLTPLLILDYGNPLYGGGKPHTPASREAYARFAAFVVKHFEGRVRLFELWNEWEGTAGGGPNGSAWDYVQLAKIAYPAIKDANPDAIVLSGGIYNLTSSFTAGWFRQFLAIGGLHYVDALSLHPYVFQMGSNATPETAIAQVEEIHRLALAADGGRPIDVYISEMGWPNYGGPGGQPTEAVTSYVERFTLLAAALPYIRGVWWYDLRNQSPNARDRESNFGLYSYDFRAKPQGNSFARVAHFLKSTRGLSLAQSDNHRAIDVTCSDGRRATLTLHERIGVPAELPDCQGQSAPPLRRP